MTKQEEIDILRDTLAQLPPGDTYTGGWLIAQFQQIEAAIRSDVMPSVWAMSPAEFQAARERILDDARAEASRIRTQAQKDAQALADRTHRACENAKAGVINLLTTSARKLQDY